MMTAIRNMASIRCELQKKRKTYPMAELIKWVQINFLTVFFGQQASKNCR
jgi:hypothetical protein